MSEQLINIPVSNSITTGLNFVGNYLKKVHNQYAKDCQECNLVYMRLLQKPYFVSTDALEDSESFFEVNPYSLQFLAFGRKRYRLPMAVQVTIPLDIRDHVCLNIASRPANYRTVFNYIQYDEYMNYLSQPKLIDSLKLSLDFKDIIINDCVLKISSATHNDLENINNPFIFIDGLPATNFTEQGINNQSICFNSVLFHECMQLFRHGTTNYIIMSFVKKECIRVCSYEHNCELAIFLMSRVPNKYNF